MSGSTSSLGMRRARQDACLLTPIDDLPRAHRKRLKTMLHRLCGLSPDEQMALLVWVAKAVIEHSDVLESK